ncbi:MAG: assimilatory sulfite reductase (NADPH) flavoprotein subunit [Luteimonas sp.]
MPSMSAAVAPAPPLSSDQATLLSRLTEGLDVGGLWWLSGYAAGLARSYTMPGRTSAVPAIETPTAQTLTIVYGSQTGNAKRLAETLAQQAEHAGVATRLLRADAYPTRELKNERHLYIVISTQGDGDPPDDARAFVEFIAGKRAPELKALKYAVLGLGDSSYPQFCVTGRQLDERLAELGASRLLERGEADLDIETIADPWLARALGAAKAALKSHAPSATVVPIHSAQPRPLPAGPAFTRSSPFAAELLANQRITGRGSDRDIRHVEVSLQDSGLPASTLHYVPGDALGVWPVNPPALVDAVLAALDLEGNAVVTRDAQSMPLCQWLSAKRELTRLSRPFVAMHAERARSDALNRLLAPRNADGFAHLLAGRQVIDLLRSHPAAWSADDLVAALRPLAPRLYSIASSQKVVGEEAHLTVAHVQYNHDGDARWGAASNCIARAAHGDTLPVFIERNKRFRLPNDPSRDIVMIGPGTGVAPFRGFVQERVAVGAGGRNWLLFGNPHGRSDFLYQLEWQRALKQGGLHRLDLAFSRDGAEKVYVQHRLREHGRELFTWLQDGAHLYVCGATAMAKDVHAALLDVIAGHGGKSAEDANDYLNDLQARGRYARDVY